MDESAERLTLEEHRELAHELRAACARLRELSNLVVGVYGPENRAAFSFLRAAETVERLRDEMQTQASLDWPDSVHEHIYG
jgi:hypothetical protein